MKTKIFILTWVSYTNGDNFLFSDVNTFTDEKDARSQFEKDCKSAYEECEWGSKWDEPEDERDENCKYNVYEQRYDNCYTVNSEAYEGYKVEVNLIKKEIEL